MKISSYDKIDKQVEAYMKRSMSSIEWLFPDYKKTETKMVSIRNRFQPKIHKFCEELRLEYDEPERCFCKLHPDYEQFQKLINPTIVALDQYHREYMKLMRRFSLSPNMPKNDTPQPASNMIEYKEIPTQYVELFNEEGFFAKVNEHELNCIRVQIKEEKAEGFYIIYNDKKIRISNMGSLEEWPKGLFDLIEHYLGKLSGYN